MFTEILTERLKLRNLEVQERSLLYRAIEQAGQLKSLCQGPNARVGQDGREVVELSNPKAKTSQDGREALTVGNPAGRVAQLGR